MAWNAVHLFSIKLVVDRKRVTLQGSLWDREGQACEEGQSAEKTGPILPSLRRSEDHDRRMGLRV